MGDYIMRNMIPNTAAGALSAWNLPRPECLVKRATDDDDSSDKLTLDLTKTLGIAVAMKAMHVKVKHYGTHKTLDTAFEEFNTVIDKFNECVQGYYRRHKGERLPVKFGDLTLTIPEMDGIFDAAFKLEDTFTEAADKLVKDVGPLVSLKDDVLNAFNQLYYSLDSK